MINERASWDHLFWRDANLSFSEQVLDEGSDASAGDGDVLDARADDVALRHGDHVGHPVPRVDHHACQGSLAHLGNIGRGSKSSIVVEIFQDTCLLVQEAARLSTAWTAM